MAKVNQVIRKGVKEGHKMKSSIEGDKSAQCHDGDGKDVRVFRS